MNPNPDYNNRFFASATFRKIGKRYSIKIAFFASLQMIVFSSLILLFSCKKEKLPPETQHGANTVGCMINDMTFKASDDMVSAHYYDKYNTPNGFMFILNATKISGIENMDEDYINISMDSISLKEGGTYPFRQYKKGGAFFSYRTAGRYPGSYFTSTATTNGELRINYLNLADRIVSGTFWYNTANNGQEKFSISKGRFDVKFK